MFSVVYRHSQVSQCLCYCLNKLPNTTRAGVFLCTFFQEQLLSITALILPLLTFLLLLSPLNRCFCSELAGFTPSHLLVV